MPTDRQASARRGRPARFTSDELLDLVVAEFNARGYDATSMEDLARATGLTKSAVYHHVAGKEALLRLALTRAVDALFAVLDEPASRTGPAADRLAHVVRRAAEVLVSGTVRDLAAGSGLLFRERISSMAKAAIVIGVLANAYGVWTTVLTEFVAY